MSASPVGVEVAKQGARRSSNYDSNGIPKHGTYVSSTRGYAKKGSKTYDEQDTSSSSEEEDDQIVDAIEDEEDSLSEEEMDDMEDELDELSNAKMTKSEAKASAKASAKTSKSSGKASQQAPKASANAAPTKASAPSNSVPRTPYVNNARSGPMAALTKGSARASANLGARASVDITVAPEADNMYTSILDLHFHDGNISEAVVISGENALKLFSARIKNPDKAIEDPYYYDTPLLKDFFLGKIKLLGSNSTYTSALGLSVMIGEEEYLNNSHVYSPGKGNDRCLVVVPYGNVTPGKGRTLVSNMDVIQTKTFTSFGHLDESRIMANVRDADPNDPDQRLKYKAHSALGRLILHSDNRTYLIEKEKGPLEGKIDEERDPVTGEHWIRIGPNTLAHAVHLLEKKIKPHIKGRHNLSLGGFTFRLRPLNGESTPRSGHAHISLKIKYTYVKGSLDVPVRKMAKPETAPQSQTEVLRQRLMYASGKAPTSAPPALRTVNPKA